MITLHDLRNFVEAHENPDVIIISREDFKEMNFFMPAHLARGFDSEGLFLILGETILRRGTSNKPDVVLDWSNKRIPRDDCNGS